MNRSQITFRSWDSLLTYSSRQGRVFCCGLLVLIGAFHCFLPDSAALSIKSRAAVVMDASTEQVLFSKDPDRPLPPASTTKLMTAILVMETKSLSDIVTISRNASRVHPWKAGLKEGNRLTVEALLYTSLLKSANDAAVALAEAVAGSEEQFVDLMNKKAIFLGATNTKFINSTGLPGPDQYTTAIDLAKIMGYAIRYPKLREIVGTPVTRVSTEQGKTLSLRNTDRLLWSDEEIIGGKTGYTLSAGHCFVCAAGHDTKTIIVAVLGSPTRKNLWKETGKLISIGFERGAR